MPMPVCELPLAMIDMLQDLKIVIIITNLYMFEYKEINVKRGKNSRSAYYTYDNNNWKWDELGRKRKKKKNQKPKWE